MDQKLMELRVYALRAFIPPSLTQHGAHRKMNEFMNFYIQD